MDYSSKMDRTAIYKFLLLRSSYQQQQQQRSVISPETKNWCLKSEDKSSEKKITIKFKACVEAVSPDAFTKVF